MSTQSLRFMKFYKTKLFSAFYLSEKVKNKRVQNTRKLLAYTYSADMPNASEVTTGFCFFLFDRKFVTGKFTGCLRKIIIISCKAILPASFCKPNVTFLFCVSPSWEGSLGRLVKNLQAPVQGCHHFIIFVDLFSQIYCFTNS